MQPPPDEMQCKQKESKDTQLSAALHAARHIFATRDFGIVLRASPSLTTRYAAPGAAKFTAQYLAPESLSDSPPLLLLCVCERAEDRNELALFQLPTLAENLPGNLLVCVMRNRRRFIEINTRVLGAGSAFGATAERKIYSKIIFSN
jgi:hypothetical protein